MDIKSFAVGVYLANCYIITDDQKKETVVIDPGGDGELLSKEITGSLKYILLTHGHADHTGAVAYLKDKFNAPVYMNEKDYKMIECGTFMYGDIAKKVDKFIDDHDSFKIGNKIIKCIYTPGHTPGGMSFLVDNIIFTGDTLFLSSIGRTDFDGGDYDAIINSIKQKLMVLPDETIVCPGHGPKSSIGSERINNPFL
ncbi:MBL fold metallo-hydrolase [Clostridium fermenticellae]|uniref:MBL fold metallo-hydrolase n=1 Tax=Clostridium fermenticellae TaxID=2068654 RepID=A0A386H2G8_9CLOT|nr:MBL fold metallo-hydrolase [Clostridium fermenticellae]AYD39856.1 MBL fold metallo-hydrolase [Clostridium fermenticellae]